MLGIINDFSVNQKLSLMFSTWIYTGQMTVVHVRWEMLTLQGHLISLFNRGFYLILYHLLILSMSGQGFISQQFCSDMDCFVVTLLGWGLNVLVFGFANFVLVIRLVVCSFLDYVPICNSNISNYSECDLQIPRYVESNQ